MSHLATILYEELFQRLTTNICISIIRCLEPTGNTMTSFHITFMGVHVKSLSTASIEKAVAGSTPVQIFVLDIPLLGNLPFKVQAKYTPLILVYQPVTLLVPALPGYSGGFPANISVLSSVWLKVGGGTHSHRHTRVLPTCVQIIQLYLSRLR